MSDYSDMILAEPSLVHYWRLADDTDSKGSATLTIGAGITLGETGHVSGDPAARFDRSLPATSFIQCMPPAYTGAHTVEILMKLGTYPNSVSPHVMDSTNAQATSWYMGVSAAAVFTASFQLGHETASNYFSPNVGNNLVFSPGWHHCVLAIGADGSWQFMVDGGHVGAGIWSRVGSPSFFKVASTRFLSFGWKDGSASFAFDGWMQHIAVYNTKLSLAEVQVHSTELGLTPPVITYNPPGPVAGGRTSRMGLPAGSGDFTFPTSLAMFASEVGAYRSSRMSSAPGDFSPPVPFVPFSPIGTVGGIDPSELRPIAGQVWPRAR